MLKKIMGLGIAACMLALLSTSAMAQNLVENGSFEEPAADAVAWPGYFGSDAVTGWTREGNNGGLNNNLSGPNDSDQRNPFFGEGRPIPDGGQVYFIQRTDPEITLSQDISGLEEGEHYLFIFYAGIRPNNPGMDLVVTLGGEELVDRQFTNNSGPLERVEVAFQYDIDTFGENPTLAFTATYGEDEDADTTMVLDHVQIRPPQLAADISGPGMVAQGDNIAFNVDLSEVVGDANYQWYYDGVELQGETGATLELLDVVIEDSGVYSVEVNDAAGSTTAAFTLVVVEALPLSSVLTMVVLALMLAGAGFVAVRRVRA